MRESYSHNAVSRWVFQQPARSEIIRLTAGGLRFRLSAATTSEPLVTISQKALRAMIFIVVSAIQHIDIE
jgi:hypothetical protein